jgi:preprotein translocase subunit SecE
MSDQSVTTVTSAADRAKVGLAIAAIIAGLVGFYWFAQQPMVARVGMVLAGLGLGAVIAWFSGPGQRFFAFWKDSLAEAKRVSWPDKKEALQITGIVFLFVLVMSILLWLTDKTLEWVMYDLLLGWKK